MKSNQNLNFNQSGFTLLEMLTVISIMGIIASVFIANFNAQRVPRDLNINRNETITNARKVQNYTLSSRDSAGNPIKFYVLTFSGGSDSYTIKSLAQSSSSLDGYAINLLETVKLSGNVKTMLDTACAQVYFSAPFGKMYINTNTAYCQDDQSLKNILSDPITLSALSDATLTVRLEDTRRADLKNFKVVFWGLSGKIDKE